MIKKLFICVAVSLLSVAASAGNLINNAVIKEVASSHDGKSDNFYLRFESGDGVCAEGGYVIFPREMAPSEAAFNRMFSIALSAFSLEKTVRVYSLGTDLCTQASLIEIRK